MNHESNYPRIWDRDGERRIVGETRVSWLVADLSGGRGPHSREENLWKLPLKVPKAQWNRGCQTTWPKWFDSEKARNDFDFMQRNRYSIGEAVRYGDHDATTLRKVAELIGYEAKS